MSKAPEIRSYELSFITIPDLSDHDMEKLILEMREIIEKEGGKDIYCESWGTRTTPYPIKKRTKLNYHGLFFNEGNVNAMTKILQYKTNILRFMCVKAKDKIYSAQEPTPLAQSLMSKSDTVEGQPASE